MSRTPEQMLVELQKLYEKYSEFRDNGMFKMRRKLTKQNTEQYEFEFSNYTYYYDSPPNLINFESPETQKEFAAEMVAFCEEDFTKYITPDPDQEVHERLRSILAHKNNFKDTRQILYQHFASKFQNCQDRQSFLLKAQKRLLSQQKPSEIDRCIINGQLHRNAIERKSYHQKLIRLSEAIETFRIGKETQKRVTPKTTEQGKSSFFVTAEEMSCSPLQKTDFVAYARSKLRDQRIMLNVDRIKQEIQQAQMRQWSEIHSRMLQLLRAPIQQRRSQEEKMYNFIYDTIYGTMKETNRAFIDDEQKMDKLRQYCRSVTPLRTQQMKFFIDINESHQLPKWIPFLEYEFEELVRKACKMHLNNSLMDFSTDQELYYVKMSNYISVEFRHLSETFRYVYGDEIRKEDQDQATQRVIKIQLEEIFQAETTGQLIKEVHRKVRSLELSTVTWDHLLTFKKKFLPKEQLISDILNSQNFFDPTIKTLINLLDGSEQEFRKFTSSYTKKVLELKNTRFGMVRKSQNYMKVSDKQRLLEIIMKHLDNKTIPNKNQLVWDEIFSKFLIIDYPNNLLEISYNLIFIKMMTLRNKLINILNAQNCLQKNVVSGLSRISHSKAPFQFTEAFNMKFSNMSTQSQQKYKIAFPVNQNCNPQSVQQEDEVKEYPAAEEDPVVPDTFVIGRNRMDASKCFGHYILYPKSLKQYHKLMAKIEKICSYYIQMHQNNLPQSDFTEMCDRYVMLHSLMEWQTKLQYNKLQLMLKYDYICKRTVNSQALYSLYERIMDIKNIEYIIDNQSNYFQQNYNLTVLKLEKQCNLIYKITNLLMRSESEDNARFASQTQTQNKSNEIPQMTVNYYSVQSNLTKKSEVSDTFFDRRSIASDDNDKIVYSAHHNQSIYEVNQYLLKNNLADILQENQQKSNIIGTKRQQLIGFHQKPLMNDSLLGSPFWFIDPRLCLEQLQSKQFQHLWRVIEIIDMIESRDSSEAYKVSHYCQAITVIETYEKFTPECQNLLHEDLLSNYLDKAAKSMCSLQQNIENMNFSRLSLNYDIQLFKAIKLKEHYDLIKYRGLYLCMNFIEAIRLNSIMVVNRSLIETYSKTILQIISQYSPSSADLSHFFNKYTFEKCGIDEDSLLNYPFPNQTPFELLFGEHLSIFRTNVLYEFSLCEYFKQVCVHMYRKINSLNLSKCEAQTLLVHKLNWTSKKIPTTFDMVDLANKFESLKRSERSLFSKTEILYYVQLKEHALRHAKAFNRVKVVNIDTLIQQKETKLERLYLAKCKSYCLFRVGEFFRYDNYLLQLRDRAKKYATILPFVKNSMSFPEERLVNSIVYPEQQTNYVSLSKLNFPRIIRICEDITSQTNQSKKLFDKVFPFEITPQIEEQSQSQYQYLKHKVKRYILSLTPQNFTTNLKCNQRRIMNKKVQYDTWQAIVSFIENWVVQMSLSCTTEEQIQLRSKILHNKSIAPTVFDENSSLLARENVLVLRRICESSKILQMCETQYQNQDNLKKIYSEFLRDLREFAELALNVEKGTDDATPQLLALENRLRQKELFIALRQRVAKNEQYRPVLNQIFNPQEETRLVFRQSGNEPEQSYASAAYDYNLLEKKFYTFEDFRKLKQLFQKSPVSLSNYVDSNYTGWITHRSQINVFTRMKSLQTIDIEDRKVISDRLSDLTLIANMYNIVKSSNNRQMQLLDLYYQGLRMRDFCKIMNVQVNISSPESLARKITSIEALIFNKSVKLNKTQTLAMQYSKSLQNAKIYDSMSQRICKLIADKKMFEVEFYKQRFRKAVIDFTQQLKLLEYMQLDAERQRLLAQEKVRQQLVNIVIVPQIKINSFLSSPLCLDKYFLPHTCKLAYIQSFLNKLRNKVLQIQLIDEEFGYLIKTKDLQECVSYLCKTFLSFSEKEFSIRTKSLTCQIQVLELELMKTKSQLQDQKNRNYIFRQRSSGLLNSLVISKTTALLVEFFNMRGRWDDMMRIVKALESQQTEEAKKLFLKEIDSLKCQSQIIKDQYTKFKNLLSTVFRNDIQQSKITLEKKFIQKVEEVLGTSKNNEERLISRHSTISQKTPIFYKQPQLRHVLTSERDISLPTNPAIELKYNQQQEVLERKRYEQSEVYLKMMAKQKAYFILKINSMINRHQKQIDHYKSQLTAKDKIQNSYFLEKKKCDSILKELNNVNDKIKQYETTISQLNRQNKTDQHARQKLCRLNEALCLKIHLLEAQNRSEQQLPSISSTVRQNNVATQTTQYSSTMPKITHSQPKPVDLTMQKGKSSDFRYQAANQFSVWRQKYDSIYVKYTNLMNQVTKIRQVVHVCREIGRYDLLIRQIAELPRQQQSGSFAFKDFEVSIKPQSRSHMRHRRLKTTVIPEQSEREL